MILGAGPRVGRATAEKFANAGYNVAVASRKQALDPAFPWFVFDGSKPERMESLFDEVKNAVGIPSVVIFNSEVSIHVGVHWH